MSAWNWCRSVMVKGAKEHFQCKSHVPDDIGGHVAKYTIEKVLRELYWLLKFAPFEQSGLVYGYGQLHSGVGARPFAGCGE